MRRISLYQVYDNIGNRFITQVIPCDTSLIAALGFYNSYIKEKDPLKNPFKYQALDLVKQATFDVDEDGKWLNPTESYWECSGKDIKSFISSEMAALGIDNYFEAEDEDVIEKGE